MAETGIEYRYFKGHHPECDVEWFRRCKALYAGGRALLSDGAVLGAIMPKHSHEAEVAYAERVARAFYINYAGTIIAKLAAGLFTEQPVMRAGDGEALDDWYTDFFKDVTPPGGKKLSFVGLLKRQIITALCCRRAWTLVELPDKSGEVPPETALEEEKAGALECYAYPVDPECVRDWEMDEDGKLKWCLLAFQRGAREGLVATRNWCEEEFVFYTATEYQRYLIRYDVKNPPKDSTIVPLVANGTHTFGRVPVVSLELTDGMYAMGQLAPIAVAHFNQRNALSWAMFKSLFPVPTAFLGEEKLGQPVSEDQGRATNQVRSPGHISVLAKDDDFRYIGPPTEPFQYAAADCTSLRDEMYRVVHSMADSVDNSGAALQRSGTSKQMDLQAQSIVQKELGEVLGDYAVEVMECVCAGRKDVGPDGECLYAWNMIGMEEFNQVDMDGLLKEVTAITTLDINSPSFQVDAKMKVAKSFVGDDVDEERLEQYRKELESNNPAEQFAYKDPVQRALELQQVAGGGNKADGAEEDEDDKQPPPKFAASVEKSEPPKKGQRK